LPGSSPRIETAARVASSGHKNREDTLFDPDPGEPLITDAGLAHLETLSALTTLHVAGQRLTEDGLSHLEGLSKLEQLMLSGPGLTDAGLGHLERLTRLRMLMIYSRDVSAEAQEALRIKLPGLVIMP